jgi:lipopolysaccharide biosynthesis regulator YciM
LDEKDEIFSSIGMVFAIVIETLFANGGIRNGGVQDEENSNLREGGDRKIHHHPKYRCRPCGNGQKHDGRRL